MNIEFCEKYGMLPQSGIVLCAVSGGKDSMYLIEKLRGLSSEYGFELACAHFNHRLRGEESDRDEQFVRDYCEKRKIPCYIGTGDVRAFAQERHQGTEEAARILRYEFLEKTADDIGAVRIATAHTADDNAETVLFNLSRGSGLKGLCGIPPVRGRLIRPMLQTGTEEVLSYLEENKVPHVEDSTNAGDDYMRNRIRHRIIPELREINGGFDGNLMRCSSLLREDEEFLSSLAQSFIEENFSGDSLPAGKFAALPKPVSARVLRFFMPDGMTKAHIEAVRKVAESDDPHGAADISGMRILRDYDRLILGAKYAEEIPRRDLHIGETAILAEAGLQITLEFIKNCKEIHNSFNTFSFQSDSICGNIFVKSRSEGEKIRLNNRKITKTLKKLFSENRINGEKRAKVPVLYDENGVIAVYGFGIAERVCPTEGNDVLKVEIRILHADDINF